MCIIIACDSNHRPDDRTIARSWAANPDGGGMMWADGGTVHISKGYMRLDDYMDAIHTVPVDCPMVLHMRIGTSGGFGPEVTHPYPVTTDLDALHALDVDCPVGIAHNGVLPYETDDTAGISDTVAYIMQIVAPLAQSRKVQKQGGLARSQAARKRLKATSQGSRLAILDARGNLRMIGEGWQSMGKGLHASNGSWHQTAWTKWIDCEVEDCDDWDFAKLPAICESCSEYKECRYYGPWCDEDTLAELERVSDFADIGGDYTVTD